MMKRSPRNWIVTLLALTGCYAIVSLISYQVISLYEDSKPDREAEIAQSEKDLATFEKEELIRQKLSLEVDLLAQELKNLRIRGGTLHFVVVADARRSPLGAHFKTPEEGIKGLPALSELKLFGENKQPLVRNIYKFGDENPDAMLTDAK